MSSAENEPGALWSRVLHARAGLRELSIEGRLRAIASVAAVLGQPDAELLTQLAASCGLSIENVRFGLTTTFGAFDEASLRALARSREGAPYEAVALVLAGNVFTAAARPMLLALLAGAPVLAKASSQDSALPLAIARLLSARAPALGAACAVLAFSRDDARRMRAALEPADSVHVLGGDEAVAAVGAQLTASQHFVGRGHGLGFGLVERGALASPLSAALAAHAFALDVAAYDQRGCLSPHAVFVERGGAVDALGFARLLYEELHAREQAQPRGALPKEAAAEQMQWRGLAAARGELLEHERFAVSCEHDAAPRPSPGYRNVGVYALDAATGLGERCGPLARWVKALGVAGAETAITQRSTLGPAATLAPYVCAAGSMQTPPLAAPLDRLHPLEGFVRD
jgi:hypothetical protein